MQNNRFEFQFLCNTNKENFVRNVQKFRKFLFYKGYVKFGDICDVFE